MREKLSEAPLCKLCRDSGRPGYIVFARYYDRMTPTDIMGEFKATSGVEWVRCICAGRAALQASPAKRKGE